MMLKGNDTPLLGFLQSKEAVVSGKLDVNGVIPDGSTVTLRARESGVGEYKVFASGLPVADQESWSFTTALRGKNYDIQGQVVVDGSVTASSSMITVTAPADDERLVFNLADEKQTTSAVISGDIKVSGYIPSGSTITVKGRRLGDKNFTTVASDLRGQASQTMNYTTAISGKSYEVQATLLNSGGTVIGTSSLLVVAAPATNEDLEINSSAAAPAAAANNNQPAAQSGNAVISGSINFNGSAPANSRIVILQHGANSTNFQVAVNNVTPANAVTWSWNGATSSTWYTVMAVLKQTQSDGADQDIASSAPIQIPAPANNVTFTINSGIGLSAPTGSITTTCQTYNSSTNQWNVIVYFQSVPGAQSYWYQVGTSTNSSSNTSQTGNSNNAPLQQIGISAINGQTYNAQYAYANVPNLAAGSSQYSGFSASTPFQCNN